MTIYVDALVKNGWILRGRPTPNCHLFTDGTDLEELHRFADRIGLLRAWYQPAPPSSVPHYDLTPGRRRVAVLLGALEVDRRRAVEIWRDQRHALQLAAAGG